MQTPFAIAPPTAGDLTIQFLSAADAEHMYKLQQQVYESLAQDQKGFIVPKSEGYFREHFARGKNFAIGVFVDDILVGQCLCVAPDEQFPATGMVDMAPLNCQIDKISVIQGLLVLPHYRGKGIGKLLIEQWYQACRGYGKTHLLVETAVANHHSWSLFLDAGIPIVSRGIDSEDGTCVFNHLRICE